MFSLCFMCKRGVMRRELRMRVINYIIYVMCIVCHRKKRGGGNWNSKFVSNLLYKLVGVGMLEQGLLFCWRVFWGQKFATWFCRRNSFLRAFFGIRCGCCGGVSTTSTPFFGTFQRSVTTAVHWDYVIMSFNSSLLVRLIRICKNF